MMNKQWTLHVENFSKIKSADVTLAPLMCFVGSNNSGKSYLMSLLWGILTYGKELFPQNVPGTAGYKKCQQWMMEKIENREEVTLNQSDIQMYVEWYNDLLQANKKNLIRKIFNNNDIEIEKVEIRDYSPIKNLKISWKKGAHRYSVKSSNITFPDNEEYTKEEILRMNAYVCWNLLMEGIAAPLYTPMVGGRRMGEPIYLPASRTGFMLTFAQLLDKSLQAGYAKTEDDTESGMLTMPYVDFLRLIIKFDTAAKQTEKYKDIVKFLEESMTKGTITAKKDYLPSIRYRSANTKKEIPLYLASSVVSEISPMILLLKSNINFKAMIIEEPEAHLHPALQQKMAQYIIQLVNSGVLVWVTTHSDTILQHMNNMIKLNYHKEKDILMEKHKYKKSDLLDENDVGMYQFMQDEKYKTELVALEKTKYGFVVPTFNDAIQEMLEEVYAFQED